MALFKRKADRSQGKLEPDWMRATVGACQEKAVELAEILT